MAAQASDVIAAIKGQLATEARWDMLETIDPDEAIDAQRDMLVAAGAAANALDAYVDARIAAALDDYNREKPAVNEAFATYGSPRGV